MSANVERFCLVCSWRVLKTHELLHWNETTAQRPWSNINIGRRSTHGSQLNFRCLIVYSSLTNLSAGIWGWCWWEQCDKGVALGQTSACCCLHGAHVAAAGIRRPAAFTDAPTNWRSDALHKVLFWIFSIQGGPLGSAVETGQWRCKWKVFTMDAETVFSYSEKVKKMGFACKICCE